MIPSVLIIEDARILAHAMRDYLAHHGYEPVVAWGGGPEAAPRLGDGPVWPLTAH